MNADDADKEHPRKESALSAFICGKTNICAILAATALLSAQPSITWRTVAAGVEHAHITRERDAAGNPGPWNINLLRVDPSRVKIDVVHARDAAVGVETVSAIAASHRAIAAVNGGYFRMQGSFAGDSTGTLQIDGVLVSEPDRGRAAVGFVRQNNTTRLVMGHVKWEGRIDVEGRHHRLDGLNRPRGRNDLILFAPGFDRTTRTDASGLEVVVRAGRVDRVIENTGNSEIPADGFVLSAMGTSAQWARAQLRPGLRVNASATLLPLERVGQNPWRSAEDVLGAGPMIVSNGRIDITAKREKMRAGFDVERHPRTAIASLTNGSMLLVVVDGRQPALSVGMSLPELARLVREFGAVDAMNLDGGGSTTMVVNGTVVNHPSDPTGERPVSDAVIVVPK